MAGLHYNRIYKENYGYDILTPDITGKKVERILWEEPEEDCPELVHEIHITDISTDPTEYLNLDRNLGGLPRLDNKGNFTEACSTMNSRFQTKNGVKTMVYYSPDGTGMLRWQDCKPTLIPNVLEGFNEPSCKLILIISAKKLKMYNRRMETLKPTIKKIKKMGKSKYTEYKLTSWKRITK